ncbi:hypothetical protein AB0M94_38880 [Streptomyces xanthochromogenes]|uniref:hypothetical protein n=1 Tax=Streptomyces xanthochromogenes TaxID=67384 RepID=UPI00342002EE
MPSIIRTVAVSAAAAAAVLGTANLASAATPEEATATVEAAVNRAAGAPVSLPDGRTLHVRGLDSASYRADSAHRRALVTLADGTNPGMAGIDSSLQNAGAGAPVQQPNTVGTTPQQFTTQASAGGISVTVAVGVGLVIFAIVLVRKRTVHGFHAAVLISLGVLLAPTFVGPLVQQISGSVGSSLGNIWTGMGR